MRKSDTTKRENNISFSLNKEGTIIVLINTGLGPVQDGREIEEYFEDKYLGSNCIDYFLE